jgi:hypothetical protein
VTITYPIKAAAYNHSAVFGSASQTQSCANVAAAQDLSDGDDLAIALAQRVD